jgi:ABC-type uncharacterized transport system auxiliary subunit
MKAFILMSVLLPSVSMVLLSACMPLTSSQPAPVIYALHGPSIPKQQMAKNILHTIAIPEPEVPVGFDTNKIALYLYNGRRLDYYTNAVWPEQLGKVLQSVIIQSASATPDMMAADPALGIPSPYEVLIKVNDFEPVYTAGPDKPPRLKVSLSFRFLSIEDRKILLDATFSATVLATENTQTAIVSGLETLLRSVNSRAFKEIDRAL